MTKTALEARQKAGQQVERGMLEMLLGWEGVSENAAINAAPDAKLKPCEHDMGSDPERGPNGCRLVLHGQECQCERAAQEG